MAELECLKKLGSHGNENSEASHPCSELSVDGIIKLMWEFKEEFGREYEDLQIVYCYKSYGYGAIQNWYELQGRLRKEPILTPAEKAEKAYEAQQAMAAANQQLKEIFLKCQLKCPKGHFEVTAYKSQKKNVSGSVICCPRCKLKYHPDNTTEKYDAGNSYYGGGKDPWKDPWKDTGDYCE